MLNFRKNKIITRIASLIIAFSFLSNSVLPGYARAELTGNVLPQPNQFVGLTSAYSLPVLRGIKFDPNKPLEMEFLIDTQDQRKVTEAEASKLIRYFLATLTIPQDQLWVNLSPYEKDRIAPESLSQTDLGKDLLSQDYILKQLSSSLTYPESPTGKDFWTKTYNEIMKISNTTKVPVNTFNKIWIVPNKAEVFENNNSVLINESTLKVMLEEDYLALSASLRGAPQSGTTRQSNEVISKINKTTSEAMRSQILPKISNEVNSGSNFAPLRQIYSSIILGLWFKSKFKDSLYRYYIDQAKTSGIDLKDKDAKDKIYNLYVEAFKKGLYNYIKTDTEPKTNKQIKRRYFSGGFTALNTNVAVKEVSSSALDAAVTALDPATQKVVVEMKMVGAASSAMANTDRKNKVYEIFGILRNIDKNNALNLDAWSRRIINRVVKTTDEKLNRAVEIAKILNDSKVNHDYAQLDKFDASELEFTVYLFLTMYEGMNDTVLFGVDNDKTEVNEKEEAMNDTVLFGAYDEVSIEQMCSELKKILKNKGISSSSAMEEDDFSLENLNRSYFSLMDKLYDRYGGRMAVVAALVNKACDTKHVEILKQIKQKIISENIRYRGIAGFDPVDYTFLVLEILDEVIKESEKKINTAILPVGSAGEGLKPGEDKASSAIDRKVVSGLNNISKYEFPEYGKKTEKNGEPLHYKIFITQVYSDRSIYKLKNVMYYYSPNVSVTIPEGFHRENDFAEGSYAIKETELLTIDTTNNSIFIEDSFNKGIEPTKSQVLQLKPEEMSELINDIRVVIDESFFGKITLTFCVTEKALSIFQTAVSVLGKSASNIKFVTMPSSSSPMVTGSASSAITEEESPSDLLENEERANTAFQSELTALRGNSMSLSGIKDILIDWENRENYPLYRAAIAYLIETGKQAVPILIEILEYKNDEHWSSSYQVSGFVRERAIWALGEIKDPEAIGALTAVLEDKSLGFCHPAVKEAIDKINSVSSAMATNDNLGGISMQEADVKAKIGSSPVTLNLPVGFNPATFQGFIPRIISIQPIGGVNRAIGLTEEQSEATDQPGKELAYLKN